MMLGRCNHSLAPNRVYEPCSLAILKAQACSAPVGNEDANTQMVYLPLLQPSYEHALVLLNDDQFMETIIIITLLNIS